MQRDFPKWTCSYAFFRLSRGPELNEEEIEVMKRFTGYVVNFVTSSKPAPEDIWPAFREGNGRYLIIDEPDRSGVSQTLPFETKARPGRMNFWREMFRYPENIADDYVMPSFD